MTKNTDRRRAVAYIRVSTAQQGKSGLGIEAQRAAISARTRDALAAAKARGVKLGNPNIAKARAASIATNKGKAAEHAALVLPIVEAIQKTGAITLRAIAAELTARKVPTVRGGDWAAPQVRNILKQALPEPDTESSVSERFSDNFIGSITKA